MKSIYETKSYKLILSYYTNTKLHKNSVFSKMITFNIVEFAVNEYGKRYQKFNHYKELPNVQVTQFCRLYPKDALFRVNICMTDKYILIHMYKLADLLFKKNGYEDTLSRYIFSKRDYRGEKSGKTLEELATKNLQYYFEKKNAIVYTKQFNSDSGRSSRFLYKNK